MVITIDGPAGTGKSTVAHRLARRLGFDFLDTGAMYRAAALIAIEAGIDPSDGPAVARAVRTADFHFDWSASPPRVMLGDRDVGERIRDADVGGIVSIVAAQAPLRAVLVEAQRRVVRAHPRLVSEGRDQGSVVFPDAAIKFYLDADVVVRARRRAEQLASVGHCVNEAEVMNRLRERDRIDSSRREGPLIQPEDAIVVDTSDRSVEDVVDHLAALVFAHVPGLEPPG